MNINRALIVVKKLAKNNPVAFGQIIISDDDILPAVETFFEEKDIAINYTVVEHIADILERGKSCWYDERYCFQITNIYES